MPKMRGETERQFMGRLRKARGLLPMSDTTDFREEIMGRTRAAVCLLNSSHSGSEASKMNAFLAIFHPEIEAGTLSHIRLMQDVRQKDQRR